MLPSSGSSTSVHRGKIAPSKRQKILTEGHVSLDSSAL